MSKRLIAMLAGVAALAVLVAGCGGGGGGDEESLTKKQFVKKANALCAQEGRQIAEELTAYSKENPAQRGTASKEQATEVMEEIVLPGFRAEVEALRELPAPDGDEQHLESIFTQFEAGLDEANEDPANFFTNEDNEFAKARAKAEKYGLTGCGTLFL